MNCPSYGNLHSSLSTDQANIPDVMDFIIHVIYNRPNPEKSPGDSRYMQCFSLERAQNVSLPPLNLGKLPKSYLWRTWSTKIRLENWKWYFKTSLVWWCSTSQQKGIKWKFACIDLIPTDEPESEHTEDDGSNDESVCVSGDEMDIEWEDYQVSVSLQSFFFLPRLKWK